MTDGAACWRESAGPYSWWRFYSIYVHFFLCNTLNHILNQHQPSLTVTSATRVSRCVVSVKQMRSFTVLSGEYRQKLDGGGEWVSVSLLKQPLCTPYQKQFPLCISHSPLLSPSSHTTWSCGWRASCCLDKRGVVLCDDALLDGNARTCHTQTRVYHC